jgi:hypothetical protein
MIRRDGSPRNLLNGQLVCVPWSVSALAILHHSKNTP